MTALLEICDLVKRYGDRTVLSGVNLRIERGETIVVLGGSGSGKSTLARVLVGLEPATSGHIYLDRKDLVGLSDRDLDHERQRFAMVFQKYALLDSLTVYDNVAFPLKERRHFSRNEIHQRVTGLRDDGSAHRAFRRLERHRARSAHPARASQNAR
jgi:phospholipid/cholesterol/gamma-HCH transport system ATP-binding protein